MRMRTVVLLNEFFTLIQEIIGKTNNQLHRGLLIKIRENTINMLLNKVESCAEA